MAPPVRYTLYPIAARRLRVVLSKLQCRARDADRTITGLLVGQGSQKRTGRVEIAQPDEHLGDARACSQRASARSGSPREMPLSDAEDGERFLVAPARARLERAGDGALGTAARSPLA